MKKLFYLFLFMISLTLVVADNNLYLHDSLDLSLDVDGEIDLIDQGNGKVSEIKAELRLYPKTSYRQELVDWSSLGQVKNDIISFQWQDKKIEKKSYGFKSKVRTKNQRIPITKKIPFPLSKTDVQGLDKYLAATINIDIKDPNIISRASKLAEGHDDLFKVVFELAKWVEANVNYELTTLTTTTSQKASWVLQNRKGVCDEMTSLFIAMSRSLGIPARFVSGISYSTSDLFDEPWLPHGWAEVYFPGSGWVGFDITFGEYGYVDVTHIKFRDGFDPAEPSTKFEWLANNIQLKSTDLKFQIKVKNKGKLSPDDISLDQEILGKEVGFGSYNLIKGTVRNKGNYYAATTLNLVAPKEIAIMEKKKKTILLKPFESKEVFWLIRVTGNLRGNYWYEFPIVLYTEKNVSIQKKFKAIQGKISYAKDEVNKLMTPSSAEKTYSQKVDFNCQYSKEVKLNQIQEFTCQLKNKGNTNLKKINYCLGPICKTIASLPINQVETLKTSIKGELSGWQKVLIKASSQEIEKTMYLEYVVLDQPNISIKTKIPSSINYHQNFEIILNLNKTTFSNPQKLKLILRGPGFQKQWLVQELKNPKELSINLPSKGLGHHDQFKIFVSWEDKKGQQFKTEEKFNIKVIGKNFWEKMILWFNGIINKIN